MARHRLEAPAHVKPRYGRLAAAGFSVVITLVALLGGVGVIPLDDDGPIATAHGQDDAGLRDAMTGLAHERVEEGLAEALVEAAPAKVPAAAPAEVPAAAPSDVDTALPTDSGVGRRVVFSESAQRVWLVDAEGGVESTYLVSGSLTDNLHPGSYEVYSRSRWAVGIDDSGVMEYFVRFTRGANAAIGFHSIPTKDGKALQTAAQLGTPQSHGCIRQEMDDAKRLWDFAPDGTKVVVIA